MFKIGGKFIMKILFICKWNRFRSKVAEAFFLRMNKNKKIKVESAGIYLWKRPYVASNVLREMEKRGCRIKNKKSRKLTNKILQEVDIAVIVANNVSKQKIKELGYKGKILVWKIKDCSQNDVKSIVKRIDDIEKRVGKLVDKLS